MVVLIGVKRWWQHVACWFGLGCRWHYKAVKRGESKERLCVVPGCHCRQLFRKSADIGGPDGGLALRKKWVTIRRYRRRKRGK